MFSKGAIIIQNDLSRPFSALPQFANNTRNLIPMTLHENITNFNLFQQNYVSQQGKDNVGGSYKYSSESYKYSNNTENIENFRQYHSSLSLIYWLMLRNIKFCSLVLVTLSAIAMVAFFYNKRKSKYDLCLETVQ